MNRKRSFKSTAKAFAFLAPMLLIILIFTIYPIIQSFSMSFYSDFNFYTGEVFEYGLSNYAEIFNDKDFILAIKNTFLYVLTVVPISIIISFTIAIMLFRIRVFKNFFRSIYFLPYVTSTVAISIVWGWLYHSDYGLINYVLDLLNIGSIEWLNDPSYAMPALIIMAIWKSLGYNILMFLVGLGNIDENLYKAAKIDGASEWSILTHITIPLLRPTLLLLMTVGTINSFKVFDEVYSLFGGRAGPAGSAVTLVYYIFEKFYQSFDYGLAAAAGVILFILCLLVTLVQFSINHYSKNRRNIHNNLKTLFSNKNRKSMPKNLKALFLNRQGEEIT